MILIIIQGETSTGKTTLSGKLVADLQYDSFSKDAFKEKTYGNTDKKPSIYQWLKLERLSWNATYAAIADAVKQDRSIIVHANFPVSARRKLRRVLVSNVEVREIYCHADGQAILKRYIARARQGTRHPLHLDKLWYGVVILEVICAKLGWHWIPKLALSSRVYSVDTTDFSKMNYDKILHFTR